MERILLTQISKRNRKLEREILSKLTLNESGFVVYPGKGPEDERTGSLAQLLIDWYLYKKGNQKPLDFNIFLSFVKNQSPA